MLRNSSSHGETLMRYLMLFAGIAFGNQASSSLAQEIGSTVIVVHESPLRLLGGEEKIVQRGVALTVAGIQGSRVLLSERTLGSIDRENVRSPVLAVIEFTKQIENDPHDIGAYVARGMVYHLEGAIDQAVKDFDIAIKRDGQQPEAYSNRGNCLSEKGDDLRALQDADKAIELRADSRFFNNRAVLRYRKVEREARVSVFVCRIVQIMLGRRCPAENGIGSVDRETILGDFASAITLDSRNYEAYKNRAIVAARLGMYKEAIDDYEEAIRIRPNYVDALNGLAWATATCVDRRLRNGRRALEAAERAMTLTGWKGKGWDTLAAAYAANDRFEEAADAEARAIPHAVGCELLQFWARQVLYRWHMRYIDVN